MTDIKTYTINIDLNKIKVRDTEDRKKWLKLIDKEIRECRKKGIPYSIQNEVNAPMNVEKGEDLRSYTVEKSQYAEEKNTNNWTENIHNVTGYLKLGGLIKSGELKGLYYNIIDIDRKSAWDIFLGNDTEEELVRKYPWIEYHKEPHYKRHINLVTVKAIPYVKETTVIDNDRNTLGIGVFSDNIQWVTGIHSINVKSGNLWTIVPNGYKSYKVLSEDEYNDIVERVGRVCRFNKIWDYGTEQKQEQKQEQDKDKHEQKQDKAKKQEFNTEQDQEFDTPTLNFIKYVVSCLLPYYVIPNRDKIVFSSSGMFAKEKIPIKITQKIIEILMEKTGDTDNSRIPTLINSYKKSSEGRNVEGFSTIKLYLGEELAKEFKEKVKGYINFCTEIFRIQDLYEVATLYLISQKPMITFQDSLEDKKPEILIYDKEKGYFSKDKDFTEIVYEVYSFDFKPYEYEYLRFYVKNNTKVKRSDCDKDLKLINVEDGMYNYVTGELLDHDPKYLSIFQYPVRFGNYDPAKKCTRFLKFFSESVAEQDQENLLNSFSYIAYRHNIKEKINFMIGEGSNGKSVLLNGIRKYVYGEENIGNLSIDRIKNDPFSLHKLVGKHANFAPDIREINSSGDLTFMKLLAGDTPIEIEEKYKNLKEIALNIKQFYSLNRLGKILDDSDATLRRLNLSNFPQKFKDELTPEEELDPLHEYKLADTELIELFKEEKESIFFGEFMIRLKNLYEKKFKFGNSANQNRARYNILNDILKIWKEKRIRFTRNFTDRFEFTKDLDESLYNFCKKHNVPKPHKDAMCKDLYKEINARHKNEDNKDTFKPRQKKKRVFQNSDKKESWDWTIGGLYCLDEDQSKEGEEEDF